MRRAGSVGMPKPLIEVRPGQALLDIASYARRGPADRVHQEEIQLLNRTVRRTPEVMVKVLTKGGRDLRAVGRHLRYLDRDGQVEIETDDDDARPGLVRPKLVHKIVLSMP